MHHIDVEERRGLFYCVHYKKKIARLTKNTPIVKAPRYCYGLLAKHKQHNNHNNHEKETSSSAKSNLMTFYVKGSYIEVYSGIELPKHDFQFNHDTNCRIYVAILPHSGLSYNMF